jgi:hypothetical protein
MKKTKPTYIPGLLERWGRQVLFSIARRRNSPAPHTQDSFQARSTRIIWHGTFYSFLVGFVPSFLFVWLSFYLPKVQVVYSLESLFSILISITLIGLFTFIEFFLLFKIGLYQAYLMAECANLELTEEPELITPVPGMLARIALEIPDPELLLFGIDPYKSLNKRTVFLKTALYKIKVMASNLFAKVLLKAVLGRTGLRVYIEYISAPITGFWDALVTFNILTELRKRIISRKIAEKIFIFIKENHSEISLIGKQTLLRAIANSIVFTKTFHPNFEYLLLKLVKEFQIPFDMEEMDDKDHFEASIAKCPPNEAKLAFTVFLLASSFDGRLSADELALFPKLFPSYGKAELEQTITLSKFIQEGHLLSATHLAHSMLS